MGEDRRPNVAGRSLPDAQDRPAPDEEQLRLDAKSLRDARMPDSAIHAACHAIESEADQLVAQVIDHWGKIGTDEPWLSLPATVSHDHLADLLKALANAALCSLREEASRRWLVERAAQHGVDRHVEGFSEELLYREYHLMRTFLWQWIRVRWGTVGDAHEAILLLDAGITLATSASLRGYHRATLEARGRWPGALDELIEEYWPLLQE